MAPSPRLEFWRSLAQRLRAGEPVFLALVVRHTHHSPGTTGARLFLSADGHRRGTLGGGVMERDVLARADGVLAERDSLTEIQTLVHRRETHRESGSAEPSGMICAGEQTNLYHLCRPALDLPAIEQVVGILEDGAEGTLCISPRRLEVDRKPSDLSRPPHRLVRRSQDDWQYEEDLCERRRLAILGGGHCALALARLMTGLGYEVWAFEARKKSPEVDLARVVRRFDRVDNFRQAGPLIELPALTWVVVMTSDVASDVDALAGALPHPFPFLGAMGSPAKLAEIRRRLLEEGFTAQDLDRLTAPVGLPIGSRTPEEIAVSVAAQFLQLRGDTP